VTTIGRGGKFRSAVRNNMFIGYGRYIHRLTDEYTATDIHRLTGEFTGLCSSVESIFLAFGTEEYNLVIFLDTEEYRIIEECTLFSCSVGCRCRWSLQFGFCLAYLLLREVCLKGFSHEHWSCNFVLLLQI
jgi:hypothetical protein